MKADRRAEGAARGAPQDRRRDRGSARAWRPVGKCRISCRQGAPGPGRGTIADLEDKVSRAQIIDPATLSGDKIIFGATVTLLDEDDKPVRYQIVGPYEADAKLGRISYNSPLGKALIGRKVEDEIEVTVPAGDRSTGREDRVHLRIESARSCVRFNAARSKSAQWLWSSSCEDRAGGADGQSHISISASSTVRCAAERHAFSAAAKSGIRPRNRWHRDPRSPACGGL
jgi:hypothetical protein